MSSYSYDDQQLVLEQEDLHSTLFGRKVKVSNFMALTVGIQVVVFGLMLILGIGIGTLYARTLPQDVCQYSPLTCDDLMGLNSDDVPKSVLVVVAHPDDAEM
jgi:hypothetical protein